MKNLGLLIAFVLCGITSLSAQQVWHVKQNGTGDGKAWDSATGDLQATLDKAQAGDQIWVAEGIYLPTTTQDRSISFNIKDGIQLFGGFAGTEVTLEERDWKEHITVLSGDIGEEKATEDNSHTVVIFKNVSSSTALDGFVVAEGEAIEGWGDPDDPTSCGAAIFNIADGELSSPIIKNCRFVNNYAFYGAAIYNYSLNQGHCKPVITDSQFENNIAELNGGVIYNSAVEGFAYPVVRNSIFIENIATFGAVVYTKYSDCKYAPSFEGCEFRENIAFNRGQVEYDKMASNADGFCRTMKVNCMEVNNVASIQTKQTVQSNARKRTAYR